MVSLGALWLPILLAAVFVFIASSIIHMVLKYHNKDYRQLPNEEAARAALRGAAPGLYVLPYCADMKDLQKPEIKQKFADGPVASVTVRPTGAWSMGPALAQWFVFCLVVSVFTAYIASRTMEAGSASMGVLRVTATVAFMGYGLAEPLQSIWMGRPWSSTVKHLIDALIYGIATGGAFAWLWPAAAM